MEIIKYELDKKNKYNVFLSNGEVITLDERVITTNELLLKKEIDNDLYDKLIKENSIYELVDIGIKYISVRLRSIKEMEEYLKRKNDNEETCEQAINILVKNKYLDDDKFTRAFINDKLNFSNMGDYKIKMELERLGVSSEIINNNIANIDTSVWENKIRKIIEKDLRTNRKYSGLNLKNKIYNHLVSGGYSKEKVISIINNYEF